MRIRVLGIVLAGGKGTRLAPLTNHENPHNSYLDAAISYGLPGAALYFAMIASACSLFAKARRHAPDRGYRTGTDDRKSVGGEAGGRHSRRIERRRRRNLYADDADGVIAAGLLACLVSD